MRVFSGMMVDVKSLRNHWIVAENASQPELKLHQMLLMKRCNITMALAVNHVACELLNAGILKKTSITDIASNFKILWFIISIDLQEFATLHNLSLPFMKETFPRTPMTNNATAETTRELHFSMRLITFSIDDIASFKLILILRGLDRFWLQSSLQCNTQMLIEANNSFAKRLSSNPYNERT